jgi:hypothetical protein
MGVNLDTDCSRFILGGCRRRCVDERARGTKARSSCASAARHWGIPSAAGWPGRPGLCECRAGIGSSVHVTYLLVGQIGQMDPPMRKISGTIGHGFMAPLERVEVQLRLKFDPRRDVHQRVSRHRRQFVCLAEHGRDRNHEVSRGVREIPRARRLVQDRVPGRRDPLTVCPHSVPKRPSPRLPSHTAAVAEGV